MGYGFKHGGGSFHSTLIVQTNKNAEVSISLNGALSQTKRADSLGRVTFEIWFPGVYTMVHESGNLSDTVNISESLMTYTAELVYVAPASNLTVGGYATGVAYCVWDDEADYSTGSIVQMSKSGYPATHTDGETVFGTGSEKGDIDISTTSGAGGFTTGLSSGETIYLSRFNYVYINGNYYYNDTPAQGSYEYHSYADKVTYSAGTGKFTVPTGVRTISVFVVGGGGSGAVGHYKEQSANTLFWGGSGGGGGRCNRASFSVIPGQKGDYTVGNGGAAVTDGGASGNNGGQSGFVINGEYVYASGGDGGHGSTTSYVSSGGDGGGGGGVGAMTNGSVMYKAGNGASNGGDGDPMTITGGNPIGTGGRGQGAPNVLFDGIYYGGGGAGGCPHNGEQYRGIGGNYGGGNGYWQEWNYPAGTTTHPATKGADGTGGGGGGGARGSASGAGGSGAVIIMYS